MASAPFYTWESTRTYRRRQARAFEVEARQAAYNRITRDQVQQMGYDPDIVSTPPTMFDQPVIRGRDIDAIEKRPPAEKKEGGGWGVLGRVAGAIDDATSTVFGGEIREPWDVLRPLKRVMDAEQRYISRPLASAVYEGISGDDYENAPAWLKLAMETVASPSTYLGGAIGGAGKVANLAGRGTMSKRAYTALVGGQIAGGGLGTIAEEETGIPGLALAGSFIGGGLGARAAMRGSRASMIEGGEGGLSPNDGAAPRFGDLEPEPSNLEAMTGDSPAPESIALPAAAKASSPLDLRSRLTEQQGTIQQLQSNVEELRASGAPRKQVDEARRLLNEAKREQASIEEAIGGSKTAAAPLSEPPADVNPLAPDLTPTAPLDSPAGAPSPAAAAVTPPPAAAAAPPGGAPPQRPGINAVPDSALRKLLGGKMPSEGLSGADSAQNKARRVSGLGVEEHEIASPIMRARAELKHTASTLATRLSTVAGHRVKQAFDRDGTGRITNLPGKPTIQDLAAKLPKYDQHLNVAQRKVLDELRTEMQFYNDALKEQGVKFGSRADVIKGGFYLPRGAYEAPGASNLKKVGAGSGMAGSKKGFQKEAEFNSMVEGITSGGLFEPFEDAIKGYASDAADQSIDAYTSSLFKGLIATSGELIGQGAASRVPQNLRTRVDSLRGRISGARETLKKREVVEAQAAKEFERTERAAKGATGRLSASESRRARIDAAFTPEDLTEARGAVKSVAAEGRTVAREIGENAARLREAQGAFSKEDRALLARVDKLNAELDRADSMTGSVSTQRMDGGEGSLPFADNKPAQKEYADALRSADRIAQEVDDLSDHAERMAARVDSLAERGEILGNLDDAAREGFLTSRRAERELLKQDRQLAVAKRDMQILALEERRSLRFAEAAGGRATGASTRTADSASRLAALQADMDGIADEWQGALAKSRQTPQNQSAIGFTGLQGTTFPTALANAANKYLRSENQPPGALRQLNNMMRGIGATADASFIGIQGLLTAGSEPGATAKAWTAAMKSMSDPDVLAKFIDDFDARAAKNSTPNSREWLKAGLQLGGSETEFSLATRTAQEQGAAGVIGKVETLPGIKQSNRAFGVAGDSDRLGTAEALQRAHPDWSLEQIAEGANLLTGWSKNRFLGDTGEWVQFAPRFFQSQLELLTKAATDWKSPTGAIARNALGRLVAIGGGITVGVNAALGNETELDPTSSNFMRMRVAGQDVSLFGTWDSLLKATIHLGQGDPGYVVRTKASPLLSKAWDVISGRSFDGPTLDINNLGETDGERLANFAKSFLPFGVQDVVTDAASGNLGVGNAIGFAGVKSSPLTKADRIDQLARNAYGKGWDELSVSQLSKLSQQFPDQIDTKTIKQARQVRRTLEPYFAVEDEVWDKIQSRPEFAGYESLDAYVEAKADALRQAGVPEGQLSRRLQQLPIVQQVQRAVSEIRRRKRAASPEIDAALVDWYGSAPLRAV